MHKKGTVEIWYKAGNSVPICSKSHLSSLIDFDLILTRANKLKKIFNLEKVLCILRWVDIGTVEKVPLNLVIGKMTHKFVWQRNHFIVGLGNRW
jgi:hypothetical protein